MADGTIYIDTAIDDNAIEREMLETEKAIKRTEAQLDKLVEKQIRFVETGGNINSRAFQGMEYDIAQTRTALDSLKVKYADMQNVMSEKKVNRLKGAYQRFGNVLGKVEKKVSGVGKSAKTSGRSLGKMLATSLLMALAFMALTAIINGLKDGIDNLAQYSSDANADLSALKSSLTQLKNSFATAFAPILSVATPILTSFLNLLSSVITKVGMLFAALSGKDTFTKAIAVQEDYAASLSDTAKETKKVTDYSTSLDEINKVSSNDNSKNNKGSVSPSEMFEEVEVPSKVKVFADKVREVFGSLLSYLKPYGEHLIVIGKKALEFLIVVYEMLRPVFESIVRDVLIPFGHEAENTVRSVWSILEGLLDFLIGVFTGDWDRAFAGLEKALTSFGDIVDAKFGFIKNILIYFDDFLQNIFAIDWVAAFGVAGYGLEKFFINVKNIWDGIKQILFGIIDFVSGVFTGDWKRAWQGVKDIFGGIFNTLIALAKIPINEIIGMTNALVRGVVAGLNLIIKGMNKLSFKVPDWLQYVPGASNIAGKKFGFDIKTISAPQIPYLATGAVIPPNAPFLAMLGDQKRGTNIEAPLDTIKQAVAEVIGNTRTGGGSYTFIGQINRRTLFEEVISEAKVQQLNTGNNPFELA